MLRSNSTANFTDKQPVSKGFKSTIKQMLSIQQQKTQKTSKKSLSRPKSFAARENFYTGSVHEDKQENNNFKDINGDLNNINNGFEAENKDSYLNAIKSSQMYTDFNGGMVDAFTEDYEESSSKNTMGIQISDSDMLEYSRLENDRKKSNRSSKLFRKISNSFIKQKISFESMLKGNNFGENESLKASAKAQGISKTQSLYFKPEKKEALKKHSDFYNMSISKLSKPKTKPEELQNSSSADLPDRRRSLGYASFLKSQDGSEKSVSPKTPPNGSVITNSSSNEKSSVNTVNGNNNMSISSQFLGNNQNLRHVSSESTIENTDSVVDIVGEARRGNNASNQISLDKSCIDGISSLTSMTSKHDIFQNSSINSDLYLQSLPSGANFLNQNSSSTLISPKKIINQNEILSNKLKSREQNGSNTEVFSQNFNPRSESININPRSNSSLVPFDFFGEFDNSKKKDFINTDICFSPMLMIDVDTIKSKINGDRSSKLEPVEKKIPLTTDGDHVRHSDILINSSVTHKEVAIDIPPPFIKNFSESPEIEWKNILVEAGLDHNYSSILGKLAFNEEFHSELTPFKKNNEQTSNEITNTLERLVELDYTSELPTDIANSSLIVDEYKTEDENGVSGLEKLNFHAEEKSEGYDESEYGDDEMDNEGFDYSDNEEISVMSNVVISELNAGQKAKPSLIYMKEASYRDINEDNKRESSDYSSHRIGIENNNVEKGHQPANNFKSSESENVESINSEEKKPVGLRFNDRVSVFETFDPLDYDRTGYPALKITAELAFEIKKELNEYKFYEMPVHKDSVIFTHYIL
ncbi:hypothetical protein AYI69_g638 [Smittium culicis]|uniref:Protein BNI4 n=1 Tax=Smittium culicis TaxID=133412 RepID=A0A1R1YSG3_9FUNG|nr:hypothetical protein AYI69_g8436 [Smittium culicis]OMJ29838.1 hypothetical protein AYI69_g638 [Smittium culicis]